MRLKNLVAVVFCVFLIGCAQQSVVVEPDSVPKVEKTEPLVCPPVKKEQTLAQKVKESYSLGIIGEVEPVRFPPMKGALLARIDTGAAGSSVYAQNIQAFEREGKKWVSFDIVNSKTGENRYVVMMMLRIGKEKLNIPFSLSDRGRFDYPVLIGRNVIKGRAIVDPSLSRTLY